MSFWVELDITKLFLIKEEIAFLPKTKQNFTISRIQNKQKKYISAKDKFSFIDIYTYIKRCYILQNFTYWRLGKVVYLTWE